VKQGPEYTDVEKPFVDQLVGMGWVYTPGDLDDPRKTGRDSFHDIFFVDDLRAALRQINLNDEGKPWLDDARVDQAIAALNARTTANLVEANQAATKLLLKGTVVDGVESWDQGRGQTVQFIDWEHPERNTFRVVNQFRVACPVGQASKFIDADLVLFVNGIPLIVVECKRPDSPSAMAEAIDQLQRYANRRKELGVVDIDEGAEELFRFNQLLVATNYERARAGSFTSLAAHFLEWKDTAPVPQAEVAAKLGKKTLSSQELLVAGMLRPSHLLDIVRHFTLFMEASGRTAKVIGRYQQFRAVHSAHRRLLEGKTRREDGELDRRGGIVWHTQGSGKSLTMVFLIRKMRSDDQLKAFKIVVVTDRKDLEKQLADTAELTEEPLTRVRPRKQGTRTLSALDVLKETLRREGKDLVFTMVQKYRGAMPSPDDEDDDDDGGDQDAGVRLPPRVEPLEQLNADDKILVLVDEAHRSHTNTQHANLLSALPNCARIGFTGTPIMSEAKKWTTEIFGPEIDRYTIRQSEADGATVPVLYDGRTANAAVQGGGDLDERFEDMFAERSEEELERIKQKYGTKGHVMEARKLIAAKARNMFRHYVAEILPNGFKAQVVAVSRRATITYYEELRAARDEVVAQLEALDPALLALSNDEVEALPRDRAFLARAHSYLDFIRRLEFAPVISGRHNDQVDPTGEWSDASKVTARIKRFKKPLVDKDPAKADSLAFLIVKSMLLTGFDAPIEQVMYLDRPIREAELLQAIARVNRTYAAGNVEKQAGMVVDYYGVGQHLKEALAVYAQDDVKGALTSLKDDVPKLRDQRDALFELFAAQGVADLGRLSAWDRKELARRFARWRHGDVADPARAAVLGDGTDAEALRAIDALERFLLAPTLGADGTDPYERISEKTVSALKTCLTTTSTPSQLEDATDKLVLQLEPAIYKLLALIAPEKYAELKKKKRGFDTGLLALIDLGRSRYILKLSKVEFEQREGWVARSSYDNSVRDVMEARLDAAHLSVAQAPTLWESAVAFLLGLVDQNRDALLALPEPAKREENSIEASIDLLRDEKLRAQFHVALKKYLALLDTVLPRPEALPYVNDARTLAYIQARARQRYRGDEPILGSEVGAKVRALINEHIESRGIDQKVPPISITDVDFAEHVEAERSPKAKASEMEHALRAHIRKHFDEDPVHYTKLSERLDTVLKSLHDRWDELAEALGGLVSDAAKGREADDSGLDPVTQAPFFDLLQNALIAGKKKQPSSASESRLRESTIDLVDHVREKIKIAGFWRKAEARRALTNEVVQRLDDTNLFPYEQLEDVAEKVVELAKANDDKLKQSPSQPKKLCRHGIEEGMCLRCRKT
jgi:type I restriction enzyme R subunit